VLVFTRTKHGANRLAEKLERDGIPAAAIHGNKSQGARTRALSQFKAGEVPVLVATDIAARGLDIEELPHVVNFELPNVAEDYVHRIGRTGRAGSEGAAVSLVDPEELPLLRDIEKLIKRSIERVALTGFVARPVSESDSDERPRQGRPGSHARPARQERPRREAQPEAPRSRHGARDEPRTPHAPRARRDETPRVRQHHASEDAGNRAQQQQGARKEADGNRARPQRTEPQPQQQQAELSEAARHQSQPQPALFSPKSGGYRRRG
jgi:ATP-dependent RNA helicase RhlE